MRDPLIGPAPAGENAGSGPPAPPKEAVSKLGILDFCKAQVIDYSF
jgi:hypothetical protein